MRQSSVDDWQRKRVNTCHILGGGEGRDGGAEHTMVYAFLWGLTPKKVSEHKVAVGPCAHVHLAPGGGRPAKVNNSFGVGAV